MIGGAFRRETVDGFFEGIHRGDELGICGCRRRKADDPDAAARADLTICDAVGRLFNDVDKGFGARFHVGKRIARHTAGAVENEHDVGGVGCNIRRSGQCECDF